MKSNRYTCEYFSSFTFLQWYNYNSECSIPYTVVVVGLEETSYEVVENESVMVEVCAVISFPLIDCPVDQSFNVSFSTNDNTAGIYMLCYI